MAVPLTLTKNNVIYAAETKIAELALEISESYSLHRVKDKTSLAEKLLRYIRVLQADTVLSYSETQIIMQCMIEIGDLYDFPVNPSVTTETIVNISIDTPGPQGPEGRAGRDGGALDFGMFDQVSTVVVDSFAFTDALGADWTYNIYGTTGQRRGTISAGWKSDGTLPKYIDLAVEDIFGTTSPDIELSVQIIGTDVQLLATISAGTWSITGSRYFVPNNGLGTGIISSVLPSGRIFIGNASNVATTVLPTGDITINTSGVTAIGTGVIVNADINSAAAIAVSKLAALTPSVAVGTDASGFLTTVPSVSTTELGYLSNVTSDIQAQLNSKVGTITGAISTVVSSNLTINRVVVSDPSGKIAVSGVTTTEAGYLSGVTSSIQTQLSARVLKAGDTMTGALINTSTGEFQGGLRTQSSGNYLKMKEIDIGAWNMTASMGTAKQIIHGITLGQQKIKMITVMIRPDTWTDSYPINYVDPSTGDIAGTFSIDSITIDLYAIAGRFFSTTDFNSSSFSRGTITILYEA
jgi:hypothetical protein